MYVRMCYFSLFLTYSFSFFISLNSLSPPTHLSHLLSVLSLYPSVFFLIFSLYVFLHFSL
uniref:Uncharacterized protein n=1 Tax=Octopus bimaculoides TaxID=37653 RepID=A0A0L8I1R7_OCTBM